MSPEVSAPVIQPLTFRDLDQLVSPRLKARGLDAILDPGPFDAITSKLSPDRLVFLTLGGGAGLTKEGVFDRITITGRMIGRQNDYDDAEMLALAVDDILLSLDHSQWVGNAYTLFLDRTGGRPTPLFRDNANRHHFTGSWIVEAGSGR